MLSVKRLLKSRYFSFVLLFFAFTLSTYASDKSCDLKSRNEDFYFYKMSIYNGSSVMAYSDINNPYYYSETDSWVVKHNMIYGYYFKHYIHPWHLYEFNLYDANHISIPFSIIHSLNLEKKNFNIIDHIFTLFDYNYYSAWSGQKDDGNFLEVNSSRVQGFSTINLFEKPRYVEVSQVPEGGDNTWSVSEIIIDIETKTYLCPVKLYGITKVDLINDCIVNCSLKKGDGNFDLKIDVSDVMILVETIIYNEKNILNSDEICNVKYLLDINDDLNLSILDIILLIDNILDFNKECGNGFVENFEECDDGNKLDGDGCSADCDIEDFKKLNDLYQEEILNLRVDNFMFQNFLFPFYECVKNQVGSDLSFDFIESCEECIMQSKELCEQSCKLFIENKEVWLSLLEQNSSCLID